MSAERNLNPTEYELLSAYIDGELTDAERQSLEERLSSDALLQQELNSLRATVSLINLLPEMQAPHNFTLTPEMVTPKNVMRFRPGRAQRSAYLSLVASVMLMFFGVMFMLSEISPESQAGDRTTAGAQAPPAEPSTGDIALLTTPTLDVVEQQAESVEDLETVEEDSFAGDTETANDSGIFLTVPGGGDEAESNIFLTVPADADSFNANILAEDGSSDTTLESDDFESEEASEAPVEVPQVFNSDMADETLLFDAELSDESDDAMTQAEGAMGGVGFSAPMSQTSTEGEDDDVFRMMIPDTISASNGSTPTDGVQMMRSEVTEEALGEDNIADLAMAEAEDAPAVTETRSDTTSDDTGESAVEKTQSPPSPPSQSDEVTSLGGLQVGIVLLIGGVLFLILSIGLFRRNRS